VPLPDAGHGWLVSNLGEPPEEVMEVAGRRSQMVGFERVSRRRR
jgi:hypothetical protein